jgi:hypothetical protein
MMPLHFRVTGVALVTRPAHSPYPGCRAKLDEGLRPNRTPRKTSTRPMQFCCHSTAEARAALIATSVL